MASGAVVTSVQACRLYVQFPGSSSWARRHHGHGGVLADGRPEMLAELEARRRLCLGSASRPRPGDHLVGGEHELRLRAMLDPVDDRRPVPRRIIGDLLDLLQHPGHPLGQAVGDLDVPERAALDRCRLGVAHDRALLVDPHGHRDVDEPEQLTRDVAGVDQARMGRGRGSIHA